MVHRARLQGGAWLTIAALAAATVAIVTHAAVLTGPKVNAAEVAMRASSPPPPYASQARIVGSNRVTASRNHDVSVWAEQIDIDGDGSVDDATFAYDEPNKILFASKSGPFKCKGGGAAGRGDMLIAVNLAGNLRRRPAGSGFWAPRSTGQRSCPPASWLPLRLGRCRHPLRSRPRRLEDRRHHDRDGCEVSESWQAPAITTTAVRASGS
jgi:hypothetical protein